MAVLAPPVQVVASGAPPFVQVPSGAPPFVAVSGNAPPITIVSAGAPPMTLFNEDGSIWSAHTAAGGEVLLTGEVNGFATDFTHPVDAERVAKKTAGTVVSSGLSFFTNAGTSTKWVYNAAGVLVNIPAGTLALDYDPVTHAAKGLLTEPQATNLIIQSAAPATQSVTVTATAYTLSIFGTGTLTLTGASTAGPLVGTGANNRVSVTFTPTAGTLTLTKSGTVTNAQLETGSVATSVIPTLAATVTRAADIISVTPASINYSATAGSWWVNTDLLTAPSNARVIGYPSGYTPMLQSDAVNFGLWDTPGLIFTAATNTLGNRKVASAFASGDRAITANGLTPTVGAGAGADLLSPGAVIAFGSDQLAGNHCNGYIRQVRYVPRRKSNAELSAETA